MPKDQRYLITSSNEETWKFDRPVVFLGDWCLLHDRRHVWENMDGVVARPYGLGQHQKDLDHSKARDLEADLLSMVASLLNQHHGIAGTERFWSIVLGHWLRRYVEVIINRVKTLEQCLDSYSISGTSVCVDSDYTLATIDSMTAIWAVNDDRWNLELTSRILSFFEQADLTLESVGRSDNNGSYFKQTNIPLTPRRSFLVATKRIFAGCLNRLSKNTDAFISDSYLPKGEDFKLQILLGQIPQIWLSPDIDYSGQFDKACRHSLTQKVQRKSPDRLEKILFAMVFELLPICYLEGFKSLAAMVDKQSWPRHPKFIFTSNGFDTNEAFKLWTAAKVDAGYQYIVGQHGNNYGTSRYMYPSVEESTADKFLTWGWSDGLPSHTQLFCLKYASAKDTGYDSKGGLLLIQDYYYHRSDTWDRAAEHVKYFEEQLQFVRGLSRGPLDSLTVRLHQTYRKLNPLEKIIWLQECPGLKVDSGVTAIRELTKSSRLVVHAYDSTGMLETLSRGIPSIAYWQNGFEHLRESAKPFYQLLVDAGIVHLSPESAYKKVNEVWNDVDSWWRQPTVVNARREFCERYAKISLKPRQELKEVLLATRS
jgi:putative transferase (TIGR04331 family)